ncbi:hypothetical protein AD998_21085 [bacterium 336/3]|nr:hypothetical protein AD998_21085 [bacterium 336/3]
MDHLKGKKIIVIGGSSGIGLSVAKMAHHLGALVWLTSRDKAKAYQIAQSIGNNVQGFALDINDEKNIKESFSHFSDIDHVYLAAGSTLITPLIENDLEESMLPLKTRLWGGLRVVRAIAHKINPSGSVVFTGGISTDRPITGAWVSGLGTSVAEQLARVLVMELPHIRFNAVSPGYTDTPMWDSIMGEHKHSILSEIASKLPTKKIASPDEVASAVLFLMSNQAITGEIIHVDGGGRLI